MIKLTIITICYNDLIALKKTVESVSNQLNRMDSDLKKQIEYLIIDGGSKDGSVEYLNKVGDSYLDRITYISEPDYGIYDAMNKGIRISKGEWVQFLNAGDIYADDKVLIDIFELLKADYDLVYGNTLKYDVYHKEIVIPHEISEIRKGMILCHQSIFFRKSSNFDITYDLNYKIVSDYNTVLRLYLNEAKFKYVNRTIVGYDMSGMSANNIINTFKEICQVKKQYGLLEKGGKGKLLYYYGIFKRKILMRLPPKTRWSIVKIKRKIIKAESLY